MAKYMMDKQDQISQDFLRIAKNPPKQKRLVDILIEEGRLNKAKSEARAKANAEKPRFSGAYIPEKYRK